jgi:hypothetical protein
MTATRGTHSTRRQRHETASGRLAALRAVLDRFDVHVAEQPPGAVEPADLAALRDYERAHRARTGVVSAIERRLAEPRS